MRALTLTLSMSLCAVANAADTLYVADIYPVSGPAVLEGEMLVRDGKIVAVGKAGSLKHDGAELVQLSGKRIYPGFVHANSLLGLTEIEAVRPTLDFQEVGTLNANARAHIAVNPDSELIPVARRAGIVAAHIAPQAQGALFTGQSAVMQTQGWTWEQMAIKTEVGVHLMWPAARLPEWLPPNLIADAKKQVADNLKAIDKHIADAKRYQSLEQESESDLRLAALSQVTAGQKRLFVHAEDVSSIRQSIEFCAREQLKCVLVGATDGWRLATEIKQSGMDVILSSPFTLPARRYEGFDSVYRNAARLHEAGIRFAIAGDGTTFAAPLEKNLPHHAAQFAAFGLPPEQALAAITLEPARILGVADRLGSLEPGKDASFIVTDGDPLEISTSVEAVYLQGVLDTQPSKHERLYKRYLERLDSKPTAR
jgi:imidazolonepropionase-like amidohydrolase